MSSHDDKQPKPNTDRHGTGNPNLDPGPAGDPDLDEGGSVRPGATPPESHSATASPPHPPASRPPKTKWVIVGISCLLAIMIFFFVAYIVGVFG
ncbi:MULTISPECIES: DUF6480 family protein [Brevibacterium]|uniref:DUF6480 family protein n=1 Tax=Brevibacterium spongiae TaxID=2909672 RepID=A0ABY5SQG4_9MICO|nr:MULTISPECIES: DUF6480 family protein [Brevibacterium]UVI35319.1 DUF6480 family protein [Brevibacterium spongiae]HJF76448.1 DUF6480 family protein [Brevibacterium linens]